MYVVWNCWFTGSKKLLEEREEEAYVSANMESDDPTQKPGWREFPRMLIALVRVLALYFIFECMYTGLSV